MDVFYSIINKTIGVTQSELTQRFNAEVIKDTTKKRQIIMVIINPIIHWLSIFTIVFAFVVVLAINMNYLLFGLVYVLTSILGFVIPYQLFNQLLDLWKSYFDKNEYVPARWDMFVYTLSTVTFTVFSYLITLELGVRFIQWGFTEQFLSLNDIIQRLLRAFFDMHVIGSFGLLLYGLGRVFTDMFDISHPLIKK